MKRIELAKMIRQIIKEEISRSHALMEKSQAAQEAERMGLDDMRFGRYGKDGKVTHKSVRGKLEPTTTGDVGLRPGKTAATRDTFYTPGTSRARAQQTPDGKLQRVTPTMPPEAQRKKNQPKDVLGRSAVNSTPYHKTAGKMASRVFTKGGFQHGQNVPKDEFLKKTGLTQQALDAWTSVEDRELSKEPTGEPPMFTDGGDTVSINDPWEL
jgi:hypothetical protein